MDLGSCESSPIVAHNIQREVPDQLIDTYTNLLYCHRLTFFNERIQKFTTTLKIKEKQIKQVCYDSGEKAECEKEFKEALASWVESCISSGLSNYLSQLCIDASMGTTNEVQRIQ